jgi:hypothetical protein
LTIESFLLSLNKLGCEAISFLSEKLGRRYFAYDIDFPVGADETAIARMEWLNKL